MKRYLYILVFICLITFYGCNNSVISLKEDVQMKRHYISIARTYENENGNIKTEYFMYDIERKEIEKIVETAEYSNGIIDLSDNMLYFSKEVDSGEQLFSYNLKNNIITQLTSTLQEIENIVSTKDYIYLIGKRIYESEQEGVCEPEFQPICIKKATKEIDYYHKYEHNIRAYKIWYNPVTKKIYTVFFDKNEDKLANEFELGKEDRNKEDEFLNLQAYKFSARIIAEFEEGLKDRKDIVYLNDDIISRDYMKSKNEDILFLPHGEVYEFSKNNYITIIKIKEFYDEQKVQLKFIDLRTKELIETVLNEISNDIEDICLDPIENRVYFIGIDSDGFENVYCYDMRDNSIYMILSTKDKYKSQIRDITLMGR